MRNFPFLDGNQLARSRAALAFAEDVSAKLNLFHEKMRFSRVAQEVVFLQDLEDPDHIPRVIAYQFLTR